MKKTPKPQKMESSVTETKILKSIIEYLERDNRVAWANRMNVGGAKVRNPGGPTRWVKFAFKGCSDIIGQMKDGRFLAIEVKKPGGKLTESQCEFLDLVKDANGVSGVAYSSYGAKEIIDKNDPTSHTQYLMSLHFPDKINKRSL